MPDLEANKPRARKLFIIILVLVLIAASVVGLVFVFDEDAAACSEGQLETAATLIEDPTRLDELEALVADIQGVSDYTQDPNCMYVVTNYFIYVGDPANATNSFGLLNEAYDPEVGYNEALGENALSPEELEPTVEFLREQEINFQNSQLFGPSIDENGQPILDQSEVVQ